MKKASLWLFVLFIPHFLLSCGDSKSSGSSPGPSLGKVDAIFTKAANEHQIPKRLLLAVAFKESNMSPTPASATYGSTDNALGFTQAQTAFGLSFAQLGLTENQTSTTFESQVQAYCLWIKKTLASKHLSLNPNPETKDDWYDWIWHLALTHRGGQSARRNIQVIFALETIKKLNEGDMWQDPETGDILKLKKQSPQINISEFDRQIQDKLHLTTDESDIPFAQYLELVYQASNDKRNIPDHIRVIHCPFSLSACLELQTPTQNNDAIRLNAHYIIPPDDSLVNKPLQISKHKSALLLTNNAGEPVSVQNAIIIMLVGDSGRYIQGKRVSANPKWLTNWQLVKLGFLVRGICNTLPNINENVDINRCMTPGVDGGVQFLHQGNSEEYQWGDIPDYDQSIFWTFTKTADTLAGDIAIKYPGNKKLFQAGAPIKLNLQFFKGTSMIEIESLERCPNNKLIWWGMQRHYVRNLTSKNLDIELYHKGPNGNGQHYFRAKAYDIDENLLGWSVNDLYIENYDQDKKGNATITACQRNGT